MLRDGVTNAIVTTWTESFSSVILNLAGNSLRKIRRFWASAELSGRRGTWLNAYVLSHVRLFVILRTVIHQAARCACFRKSEMNFLYRLRIWGIIWQVPGRIRVQTNIVRASFPDHQVFWNHCSLVVFQFCVKMHPVEGICSSGSPGIDSQGRRFSRCVPQRIEGSSSHLVTFTVLPLETGLHNISYSLETSVGNEILVKTLRVVVRKICFLKILP